MKKCSLCKEGKSVDSFHNNKSTKDGLAHWCRDCCFVKKRKKSEIVKSMKNEKWRFFRDYYMVSNQGRVYRYEHQCKKWKYGKHLIQTKDSLGYMVFEIKGDRYFTHRLVAKLFLENKYKKPHVNHIDFNPSNNLVENLEWCTHKENLHHSRSAGRMAKKLTAKKVIEIRESGLNGVQVSKKYKIAHSTACLILNGSSWQHLL